MTDTNNQPATTEATANDSKVKTVIDSMESRRLFDTVEDAAAYIEKCQTEISDFADYPIAFVGLTDEGDFDPEIYTDSMRIAVAVLTRRSEVAGEKSKPVSIVIYPSPKLEAITETAEGTAWLTEIMEKELNHIAVRNLRKAFDPKNDNAPDLADVIESMPTTVTAYITSQRGESSGILETLNATWQLIKKGIGAKIKTFANANLSKKEIRKSLESASYAAAVYPKFELRTNKAGESESLFAKFAQSGILIAKDMGLDPTYYENALANRATNAIAVADDEEDFDLESFAAEITAKPEDEAASETKDGEGDA